MNALEYPSFSQIDAQKYEKESRELRSRLKEKEKALDKASRECAQLQDRANVLQAQLNKAEDDVAELRPENARLKNQLADAKKSLEEETLSRIDLQNQLITSQVRGWVDGARTRLAISMRVRLIPTTSFRKD